MRQLVSVVTETGVAFFAADDSGDGAIQVAQTINPGFAVGEVVELGLQLTDALRLNGHTHHSQKAPPPKAVKAGSRKRLEVPAKAPLPKQPRGVRRDYQARGTSLEATREYVRTHPQCQCHEIARDLLGTEDTHTKQAIAAQLQILWKRGELIREPHPDNRQRTMYSLVEPAD